MCGILPDVLFSGCHSNRLAASSQQQYRTGVTRLVQLGCVEQMFLSNDSDLLFTSWINYMNDKQ